jgi:hypothetical protein
MRGTGLEEEVEICLLPHLHLRTEEDPVSETLCSLEYQTMEKVHTPSNSVCYTPSSEPFRFYSCLEIKEFIRHTSMPCEDEGPLQTGSEKGMVFSKEGFTILIQFH